MVLRSTCARLTQAVRRGGCLGAFASTDVVLAFDHVDSFAPGLDLNLSSGLAEGALETCQVPPCWPLVGASDPPELYAWPLVRLGRVAATPEANAPKPEGYDSGAMR